MPKTQPFSDQMMRTYADRLFRFHLLSHHLEDDSHPCVANDRDLLTFAEQSVIRSVEICRYSPDWSLLREWFPKRVLQIIRGLLPFYGYSPSVNETVLRTIEEAGFDHLLERRTSRSGTYPSPSSNVMSLGKCKTS